MSTVSPRSLFSVYTDGGIRLNFVWYGDDPHAQACSQWFQDRLKTIPVFKKAIERPGAKYPSLLIKSWLPYTDAFIQAFREFVAESKTL